MPAASHFCADEQCVLSAPFRFGTARHLGKNSSGTWTLRLRGTRSGGAASSLDSWKLTVYGHDQAPAAPSIELVTPGDGSR